jgi:hypothetical protein
MASEYLLPHEARKLAIGAGSRDVPWTVSFLLHCQNSEDAERSLTALRANCPDQFKQPPRFQGFKERGKAPLVPRILQARGRGGKYQGVTVADRPTTSRGD